MKMLTFKCSVIDQLGVHRAEVPTISSINLRTHNSNFRTIKFKFSNKVQIFELEAVWPEPMSTTASVKAECI